MASKVERRIRSALGELFPAFFLAERRNGQYTSSTNRLTAITTVRTSYNSELGGLPCEKLSDFVRLSELAMVLCSLVSRVHAPLVC